MAYPFTPAQIAAFKAALAKLAEGIAKGDKALADEAYIRQCEAAIPKPAVVPAQVAKVEIETSQPVLQSQPAQQKITIPEQPAVTPSPTPVVNEAPRVITEAPKPAVSQPQAAVPAATPPVVPDASKAKKGLFGFNWFGKKATAEETPVVTTKVTTKGENKAFAEAKEPEKPQAPKPDSELDKAVRARIADGWVVNNFFSEMPWAKPKGRVASSTPITVAAQVRGQEYGANWTVAGFFSSMPWQARPLGSAAAVALPDIKIRASLATQTVNAYFSGIPWTVRKVPSSADLTAGISAAYLPSNISTQSVSVFFASAPWQTAPAAKPAPEPVSPSRPAEVIRISSQADKEAGKMFAAATQSALAAAEKGAIKTLPTAANTMARVDRYFNTLPWSSR